MSAVSTVSDQVQSIQIQERRKPSSCLFCVPRVISKQVADEKMVKNLEKAFKEHVQDLEKSQKDPACYGSLEEIRKSVPFFEKIYIPFEGALQGKRPRMEDAHFILNHEKGLLMGVFDGHGGNQVAILASSMIKENFFPTLEVEEGDVYRALQSVLHQVYMKTKDASEGSTALICFIPKEKNSVYTATLGDSEANIYRKKEKNTLSIPLSCIRNWKSEKDFEVFTSKEESYFRLWYEGRSLKKQQEPLREEQLEIIRSSVNPKHLWIGKQGNSTNTSRSLGDCHSPVSHKAKITCFNGLMPEDILILRCDGVTDFVPEPDFTNRVDRNFNNMKIAKALTDAAYHDFRSEDNITLIGVKILEDRKTALLKG